MTPQHLEALELANHVRSERHKLKRSIKAGETKAQDVLRDDLPEWLRRMPVGELLRAIRRMPQPTINRILAEVPVSETRELGLLTNGQRHRIAKALDDRETSLQTKKTRWVAASSRKTREQTEAAA